MSLKSPAQESPASQSVLGISVDPSPPPTTDFKQTARTEPPPPQSSGVPDETELMLQAIHYRLKNPSAVINGETLRIGGKIHGAEILAIGRESVQMARDGRKYELRSR